jgi:cytochrome c oxidase assembly protein subunit 11
MFTLTYVSVPLYKIFCQNFGLGGAVQTLKSLDISIQNNIAVNKYVNFWFNAQVHDKLPLVFHAEDLNLKVCIGKSTLVFFNLYNYSSSDILFSSTYNIVPYKAGLYFNKIQCFCFEDQIIEGKQFIELPVFFFIDKGFLTDSSMKNINNVALSYSIFKIDYLDL